MLVGYEVVVFSCARPSRVSPGRLGRVLIMRFSSASENLLGKNCSRELPGSVDTVRCLTLVVMTATSEGSQL